MSFWTKTVLLWSNTSAFSSHNMLQHWYTLISNTWADTWREIWSEPMLTSKFQNTHLCGNKCIYKCTALRVRTHLINRATPYLFICIPFTSESRSQKWHCIWVDNAPVVYWIIGVVSRVSRYLLITAQDLRVTATPVVVDVAHYCPYDF